MSYEIRMVKGFETLPLRQKILKPFASLEQCAYPEDDFSTTFHFALFQNSQMVGISTFIKEEHADFPSRFSYRLRGMAIDSSVQGQGLGQKLLSHGVDFLSARGCDLIWFNARIKAFSFYEKMGFLPSGPLFEMKDIGPHKVMYKRINPR